MTDIEGVRTSRERGCSRNGLQQRSARRYLEVELGIHARSAVSVKDPGVLIVNDIDRKDNGAILSITPCINASGLVLFDIGCGASDVVQTTIPGVDSPTIRQRRANSTVAVENGREVILGGIIPVLRGRKSQGVSVLKGMPVLGNRFTTRAARARACTEFVTITRPAIMANLAEVFVVTEEVESKLGAGHRNRPRAIKHSY
jgi:general secretion pathway protein D